MEDRRIEEKARILHQINIHHYLEGTLIVSIEEMALRLFAKIFIARTERF